MTFEKKHGRPKPPRIGTLGYLFYTYMCETVSVEKAHIGWNVFHKGQWRDIFATHAEAVAYAHKIASRKEHHADSFD